MTPDMPQTPSLDPAPVCGKAPEQAVEAAEPSRIGPDSAARIKLEMDSKKFDLVISMLNRI